MAKKVLIVDDNGTNLYILETLLKGYGLDVISAENGKDALEKARLNPPNLIVTDILMPVMDGYALCREWKSDEKLKHIPLVFYTATYTESKDESFALSLGADRFMTKPQEPDALMNILKEFLEGKYTARQVATKPLGEEMEFFRRHNEILFSKLEKKMLDLEIVNRKLRISEECYRLSFRNVSDVICTMDKDLNIISISPSVEKIFGYKPQDFLGHSVYDLGYIFTPESFEQIIAEISLVLKGDTIPAAVYRFIAKDGAVKYSEISISAIVREGELIGIVAVARDITDRRRAEEALQDSHKRLNEIIDFLPDATFVIDCEDKVIAWNRSMEQITGVLKADMIGKGNHEYAMPFYGQRRLILIDLTLLPDEEFERNHYEDVYRQGAILYAETYAPQVYGGKGASFWGTASKLYDASGNIVGAIESIRDITERKRDEEALRSAYEKRQELEFIVNHSPAVVWLWKAAEGWPVEYVSSNIALYGYTPDDFTSGKIAFASIVHPDDLPRVSAEVEQYAHEGRTEFNQEYRIFAKSGDTHWIDDRTWLRRGPDGSVTHYQGIAIDITDRRRAEEALRESEEKYRSILDNIDDAYYEVDLKGNLVFFNKALISKTGYSHGELMGMNYRQFISPESCEPVSKVFSEIYRTSKSFRFFDYEAIMKGGRKRNFESWANLLFNHNNKPIGFSGMARDITIRKEVEKQLQKTLENLRKAVGTTIQVMVSAVEIRDPYTAGHQLRVAELACAIATEMGLSQKRILGIRMAGSIHDIGKLSVPAEILVKPSKLTDIEFAMIKEHARKGYEILKDVVSSWPLAEITYQHHERMDGSGYPRNLRGNDILLEARIMAVADVVESMASHRPYRPALGIDAALAEIEGNSGALYDPDVAEACLKLFREKGYKFV